MPAYTQANRHISFETALGPDVLLLKRFTGVESISSLFNFQLDLYSENSKLTATDVVGRQGTITVTMGDDSRYISGVVSRFSYVGGDRRVSHYRAELVPWLWLLTRNENCRIFQEMTAPDIIEKVFHDLGFQDFEVKPHATYKPWDYCVQYRESDFNFVSRLMEHNGIFYYFEHTADKHKLVLTDDAWYPDCDQAQIRFDSGSAQTTDQVITAWEHDEELRPGAWMMNDYNFQMPTTNLSSQVKTVVPLGGNQIYEVYDYPGIYSKSGDGDSLTKIRIEEEECIETVCNGASNSVALTAGYKFELTSHPRSDLNGKYVLTQVQHIASAPYETGEDEAGYYSNTFKCMPASRTFRPQRVTPRPFVQGPQTAFVVGPKGNEIYTDKYGRVKVQFHWDREGKYDEKSSCWIRVAQAWAGKQWGSVAIPRIGHEVIVEFLEGDPDRPIITGQVYNAGAMPPYALPDHQTKTLFKTLSSTGGGGFNELRFEDKKGDEQIFIHAEKNIDIRVKNNEYETVSKDLHLIVEQDRYEHVKNDHHETIDRDYVQKLGRDHHLKISGKQAIAVDGSQSVKVTGDVAEQFSGNHSEQVSQALYLKAGMTIVLEAPMGITLKCGGNSVVLDPSGVTLASSALITIQGSMVNINSGPGSPPATGQAGSLVAPTAPKAAEEADKADPGEMAKLKEQQMKTGTGKYAPSPFKPHKPSTQGGGAGGAGQSQAASQSTHWIEIKLVDTDNNPVPGEPYRIILPDGQTVAEGTLDEKGFARVDGIDPGTCKVTFPNLDKSVWKPK
jgi:type VI secretion system secreted protein VgrG